MGYHSFSLDPRTVLGVSPAASTEEIHEAYRLKSKKHHPDLGGDEWAFRMVARAYEVLKTITTATTSKPWESPGSDSSATGDRPAWTWIGTPPFGESDGAFASRNGSAETNHDEGPRFDASDEAPPDSAYVETPKPGVDVEEFRAVDVELIWTRFEPDNVSRPLSPSEENEGTLSVCLVISWPAMHLVARAAELNSAGAILRGLIDLFDNLHGSSQVIAGRSRIEDGRFVGWLSYPNVLAAQDAFLSLRSTLQGQGLTVKLQTLDERVPFAWHGASQEPVMSSPVS
jgi:hypothetical protein